jgi:hypothetical protein
MNLSKGNTQNSFNLEDITFTELTTIKKACAVYAQQGSQIAGDIVSQIDDGLNNVTI